MPESFGLYLILTNPVAGYEDCAKAAVKARLRYLQLRMKDKPRGEVLETARSMREITRGSATRFIVNDYPDAAMEVDADGLHLGQGDMPLQEARAMWDRPGKLFGLSTHNEEQEKRARMLAPDYIGVGPVYATPTKDDPDPVLGLERMGEIIRSTPLTTVALGGIGESNLADVLKAGAINFAVVRAVNQSPDPQKAIGALMSIWRAETGR